MFEKCPGADMDAQPIGRQFSSRPAKFNNNRRHTEEKAHSPDKAFFDRLRDAVSILSLERSLGDLACVAIGELLFLAFRGG
jgi:hypothetical protein